MRFWFLLVAFAIAAGAATVSTQGTVPAAPSGLAVSAAGQRLTFNWTAPPGSIVTGYSLEAGTTASSTDIGVLPLSGASTSFTIDGVPAGTYFVRIRARNAAGLGPPSNEVQADVAGPCVALPGAPAGLAAAVNGVTVSLSWQAPSSPCSITGYLVEAGTAPGLANLAALAVGPVTSLAVQAPPGTYHVQVRASTAGGSGAASASVPVVVVASCAAPGPPAWSAFTSGNALTLDWGWPATGAAPTSYLLTAGAAPAATGLAAITFPGHVRSFAATVPGGDYALQLTATNACGSSTTDAAIVRIGRVYSGLPLAALLAEFGHPADRGLVKVFSTVGQAFSDAHADHGLLVWNLLAGRFDYSIGGRTELYYTNDMALYAAIAAYCPTIVIPNARNVTTCFDPVARIYRWIVVPYEMPDYGTQLHELSHSFLYATYLGSEAFPWIKEGSGMFYESGAFTGSAFAVSRPLSYLTTNFRMHHSRGQLLPLATLVTLPRLEFYGSLPTLVYSQAGMFWFYLEKQHPAVVAELVDRLNNRTLTDNTQVLSYLTQATGMTLAQLDAAYLAYALAW